MPLSDGNTFGMGLLFGTCPGHLDTPGLVSTFFDSDFPSLYDGEGGCLRFPVPCLWGEPAPTAVGSVHRKVLRGERG